ncbi:MAG TPA: hypothetical protein VNQ90_00695 [Chthoniobacteraceae bacterium]|nr:hypothetical protein [Chthoniobacteraceae bacterium]
MKLLKIHRGFSLVEVTLALGIASFCLIAILGLIPVGLNSTQTAMEQTQATNIISNIIADMKQKPVGSTDEVTSQRFGITVPAGPKLLYFKNGGTTTSQGDARYKVKVTFTSTSVHDDRKPITGTIWVAWPAAAADGNEQGSVSTFFALDRN